MQKMQKAISLRFKKKLKKTEVMITETRKQKKPVSIVNIVIVLHTKHHHRMAFWMVVTNI